MTRRRFLAAAAAPAAPAQTSGAPAASVLTRLLDENLLPFWHPRSLDRERGGYHTHYDPAGKPKPPGPRMIVTQARMVWFFSRLARFGRDPKAMLAAAEHGYRYLLETMWDSRHGGFYWQVDAAGKPTHPAKHLYGQAFGLYALSEYALASGREDALRFTGRFFDLLDEKSHDRDYGGYIEFFDQDWSPAPAGLASYMGGGLAGMKLMNTHLHLMEALAAYCRASKRPEARARLSELISIESSAVVRKDLMACTDKYDRDWTPRLEGAFNRVSYGHDLENIWLIADACRTLGVAIHPYLDFFRANFEYSMRQGWDEANGGFYDSGPPNAAADRKGKVWWVQAEALVSALWMHRLTRDAKYRTVFDRTLDFVNRYQADWEAGEWHSTVTEPLRGVGDKASVWKAAYHNGRAMIECLELLRRA